MSKSLFDLTGHPDFDMRFQINKVRYIKTKPAEFFFFHDFQLLLQMFIVGLQCSKPFQTSVMAGLNIIQFLFLQKKREDFTIIGIQVYDCHVI